MQHQGQPIKQPEVTLLGVDCVNIDRLANVARFCQRRIQFGDVKLLSSRGGDRENVVLIPHINSTKDYSRFIVKELHKHVDTSHVLIIQHDGFILNPRAWDDEFLQYDYIGAPWCYPDGFNVGNGGFSLRSRKLLQMIAEDERFTEFHPEDHCIARTYRKRLERNGIKFAPEPLARRFAIEGNIKHGWKWDGQFGFHSYWATDLSNWKVLEDAKIFGDAGFILKHVRSYLRQKFLQGLRQKHFAVICQKMIEEHKLPPEEE